MQSLPHTYAVGARAAVEGLVTVSSESLPDISSAPPKEFDGPGDQWSPETLFLAAVADCYVLSFRAVAAASKLTWENIECHTQGKLDSVDRETRFTEIENSITLTLPADADASRAETVLEKAEKICLISNSLNAPVHLITNIKRSS